MEKGKAEAGSLSRNPSACNYNVHFVRVPSAGLGGRVGEAGGEVGDKLEVEEEKMRGVVQVKFQTLWLSHLAVLQSRTAAFPYKSWRIVATHDAKSLSRVSLHLSCGWQLHIKVGPRGCSIEDPAPAELAHFLHLTLDAEELLRRLLCQGLNLLPYDEDAQLRLDELQWQAPLKSPVGIPKRRLLEARIARDLTMLAPSFALEGSRYNHWVGEEDCVIAVRLAVADDDSLPPIDPLARGQDPGWHHVMWREEPFPHVILADFPCPPPPLPRSLSRRRR